MRARIVGVGQPVAGDDGVGPAVVEHLRRTGVPGIVDLTCAPDAVALIALLEGVDPVVIVDAVVDDVEAGRVLVLTPEMLRSAMPALLSTHGITVAQAIELARRLAPHTVAQGIRLVGVTIERPRAYGTALSPEVAAAVPEAAATALRLLAEAR